MEITSPGRAVIEPALKARSAELIRSNDFNGAEKVQQDIATLRAPGENLYEMYRLASEKSRSLPTGLSNRVSIVGGVLLGGGLLVAGFGAIPPIMPGVVQAGLYIAAAGLPVAGVGLYRGYQGARQNAIMEAVQRNQDYVRSYSPAAPQASFQIDRKVFLAGLQGQEARLAENGQFEKAVQMRQVHQKLSKLEGATVEEMFTALVESKDRETIDLVQGSCSQEIAQTVETLAEVGKLVAPGTLNTVREEQDSLVIGGVVLKKRAA